jgi:hypothetical protein
VVDTKYGAEVRGEVRIPFDVFLTTPSIVSIFVAAYWLLGGQLADLVRACLAVTLVGILHGAWMLLRFEAQAQRVMEWLREVVRGERHLEDRG